MLAVRLANTWRTPQWETRGIGGQHEKHGRPEFVGVLCPFWPDVAGPSPSVWPRQGGGHGAAPQGRVPARPCGDLSTGDVPLCQSQRLKQSTPGYLAASRSQSSRARSRADPEWDHDAFSTSTQTSRLNFCASLPSRSTTLLHTNSSSALAAAETVRAFRTARLQRPMAIFIAALSSAAVTRPTDTLELTCATGTCSEPPQALSDSPQAPSTRTDVEIRHRRRVAKPVGEEAFEDIEVTHQTVIGPVLLARPREAGRVRTRPGRCIRALRGIGEFVAYDAKELTVLPDDAVGFGADLDEFALARLGHPGR
jgi:hypothetical protein